MDLFLLSKNYIYSGNINVFSEDLLPSSAVLANLEKHHIGFLLFFWVFFNIYSKHLWGHDLFKMLQLPI